MIKTFKSTGIGNETPFDAEEAKRRRRLKEESRRAFEERRAARNRPLGASAHPGERPVEPDLREDLERERRRADRSEEARDLGERPADAEGERG